MSHQPVSRSGIGRRGQALYNERIRPIVETDENIGKELVLDIETGDYAFVEESGLAARDYLLARNPGAKLYGVRIGNETAYALGTSLKRTTRP